MTRAVQATASGDLGLRDAATVVRARVSTAERLDVLFLLSTLSVGGSERKIVRLAGRLAEQGMHVGIACLNGPYTLRDEMHADVPLWKLERRGRISWQALRALRGLTWQRRPSALVAVNLYPALYVALAALLTGSMRPRTIGLVNTSTFGNRQWQRRFYGALLPLLDHTVHGSEAQRELWFARGASPWRRSTVIYNGVDLGRYQPGGAREEGRALRMRLGIGSESFLIGTVGRLAREKNQAALLAAVSALRAAGIDAHVLIAGEGTMRTELERRTAELGVAAHVTFAGAISDVRPVLAALDVFVLPSVAVESFSNAALEAMAMGCPVILSDIGGAREMIENGVEGFVVPCAELEARLPALLGALAAEPLRRCSMGAAARRRVENRFSLATMDAAYRALLNEGHRRTRHG